MEIDAALDPVNRGIVAGEPVVSEHEGAARVQGGDIEIHGLLLAGREVYVQFNCLSDYGVTGTVNKMESDSRYGICSKVVLFHKSRVNE